MKFDGLDLNLLVALEALLEQKSVSQAAKTVYLTQPAMTGALKRLREYFDDELLEKRGRRMFLTPKAEELTGPVRRVLLQIRGEITRSGGFDPQTTTRDFVIIASDYAYTILLAQVITVASELAPNLTFEIVPPSEQNYQRFDYAEIDLVFTLENFRRPDHTFKELWRDDGVIISWEGANYDEISKDTFYQCKHALASFGPERRISVTDQYVDNLNQKRRIDVLLPNFTALCPAIIGTKRLAIMHKLYAQHFAQTLPIKLHKPWQPFPGVIEGVQWHSVRNEDQGLMWLVSLIEEVAASVRAGISR